MKFFDDLVARDPDYVSRTNLGEGPCCMPEAGVEKFDQPTIRCSVELFVNTVAAIVKSYR